MRGRTLSKEDESKILVLAGMGMKKNQIAEFLGLGRSTVYGVMNGKREEYNERSRQRRTPETAVQLAMETPETPRRLEGDPAHVLSPAGITPEDIRQIIKDEKKNAWGLIYSAVLQAVRDAGKGGGQDGSQEEDAANGQGI